MEISLSDRRTKIRYEEDGSIIEVRTPGKPGGGFWVTRISGDEVQDLYVVSSRLGLGIKDLVIARHFESDDDL